MCVRYIGSDNVIREEFVGFGKIEDFAAKGIFEEIIRRLRTLGLDISCCVGQGYDGASAMSGHKSGVHTLFKNVCPTYKHYDVIHEVEK